MKLKWNETLTYLLELIYQNEIAVLEPLIEGVAIMGKELKIKST